MIKNLSNSLEELNSNSVQNANFGSRELQDVQLWHAVVEYSFVMIVVVLVVHTEVVQALGG